MDSKYKSNRDEARTVVESVYSNADPVTTRMSACSLKQAFVLMADIIHFCGNELFDTKVTFRKSGKMCPNLSCQYLWNCLSNLARSCGFQLPSGQRVNVEIQIWTVLDEIELSPVLPMRICQIQLVSASLYLHNFTAR